MRVVGLAEVALAHVGHVDDGLVGEQAELAARGLDGVGVGGLEGAGGLAGVEVVAQGGHGLDLLGQGLVGAGLAADAVEPLLQALQVGQHQLGLDDAHVADGVDGALHVHHVVVVEAADDLEDGVALADVAEELVAQALALAGAAHQARDVGEVDRRVHDAPALADLGQLLHARVGHGGRRLVGLDRAEGIVRRLRVLRARQGVEEGGLAHVGQAHDADR